MRNGRSIWGLFGLWRGLAALLLLLAACTPRPGPEALIPVAPVAEAQVVRLYVATTRAPMPDPAIGFSEHPALGLSYRWFDVSVPPHPRERGIYWRQGAPDPEQDFLIVGHGVMDRSALLSRVARDGAGVANPETLVFVHGYNYTFQEALLRLAKLSFEAGMQTPPVLFSWPSKGRPLDYVADRQEALWSRDALASLLSDLDRQGGDTVLVAHSMGGWLSMEALRTLAIGGERRVVRDADVVLIAPDIDVLVFREQLMSLGPLDRPISVLVAKDDRALALSSALSTGRPRLGAVDVENPVVERAAREAQVQLIDISTVEPESPLRHSRFLRLARMYQVLRNDGGPVDAVTAAGSYVLDSLGTGLIQVSTTLTGN
ncbi:alpha/beta fold hydrolase [Salipiger sp. P9]|uniref:alpha/beta hydrolase n=1 Tax=Salipiger pentaromativorans TaxID=2943193 RepID=UPI002157188B|nr:alpha/beta fold hydrolase [Salipiger pentaromativorans]MCR8547385.1 alpha/beta fold hydrolase [Salipiger pentaromativorans]